MSNETKPKIYCFIVFSNSIGHSVAALAEDGTGLAGHLSSSVNYAKYDIGINSERKHDLYKEHYPDGYELIWLDSDELDGHEGFQSAYKENQNRHVTN